MDLKQKTLRSALWIGVRGAVRQGANSVAFFALAFFLTPQAFGLGSMAVAVGMLARLVLDRGLRDAVIQAPELTDDFLDTAWSLSALLGAVLAGLLLVAGLLLDHVAALPGLGRLVAISALIPAFAGLGVVPEAVIERGFQQRRLGIAQAACSALSATVALLLAWRGLGAVSVVALNVVEAASVAVANLLLVHRAPKPRIDFSLAARQLRFVWPITVSGMLSGAFPRIALLVVGACLGSAAAAQFRIGQQVYLLLLQLAAAPISRALLPSFARRSGPLDVAYRKASAANAGMCAPLFFGLAAVSPALLRLTLGDGWSEAGRLSALICFSVAPTFIGFPLEAALLASGRSMALMRLAVIEAAIGVALTVLAAQISLVAVAVAMVLHGLACLALGSVFAKRELGAPHAASLAPVAFYSAAGLLTFAAARLTLINMPASGPAEAWASLVLAVGIGIVVYPALVRFGIRPLAPGAYSPLVGLMPARLRRFA
jgi:O-antigen/teichoic acid export membrane protein